MDFKVKCVRVKQYPEYFTLGKVYEVKDNTVVCDNGKRFDTWSYKRNGNADFEAFRKWWSDWFDFELVEDKKVFTKKDLKNGDVIVRRNGWVEIVCVDLGVFITTNGWNDRSELNDDLTDSDNRWFDSDEYDIVEVYRPKEKCQCQFNPDCYEKGELVYYRERDTKKPYNGKVVCIDVKNNLSCYTLGKIYQFKDGVITTDEGIKFGTIPGELFYTFDDWAKWTSSKFIEIKE